jgi:adenylate cyclase
VGAQTSGVVLVVDDEESNRSLLARRLRREGYTVSLAETGRQALEKLRSRRYDLVLLDILMPEMDGLEVLHQLRSDPALQNIPVLMLSAVDEMGAVVRCIELGADDYLPKPFPPALLRARVRACLANKRMSDQLRRYTEWLFGKHLFLQAVASPGDFQLRGHVRTVLFADIRGFTAWSEGHAPEEVVGLLNEYFERAEQLPAAVSAIKTEHRGDELMAVFAQPADAVRLALELVTQVGACLRERQLDLGVGLHCGPVIEGLVGGSEVKAYCFVGDTVNTGRRVCDHAKEGEAIASATVYDQAQEGFDWDEPFDIKMKGKRESLRVARLRHAQVHPREPQAPAGPF